MKLMVSGLKHTDNIRQVAELNPGYMGFVFYEGSKRFVGEDFVMPVISEKIKRVGVFVNAEEQYIFKKAEQYRLDLALLHGDETPAFCEQVAKRINVIKAFGVAADFDFKILESYKPYCSRFLFDSKREMYEGAGKPVNWEVLKNYDNTVPCFIGGDMDLEKFRTLEKLKLNIYGLEVNSRMEIKPGYKDIIKIIQIKNNVR